MKELLDPKIKFSDFDLDKDGVKNKKDCNPFDPGKQEYITSYRKPRKVVRTLRGYDIEDYYFDIKQGKYVLRAGARPAKKSWF